MNEQWTAEDENAIDERVGGALWNENKGDGWQREYAIAERCKEGGHQRDDWKHQ